MPYKFLLYEKTERILRVTLNRPERLNALSPDLEREYAEALAEGEADKDVKVIILKGAGRAFCSGHDIAPKAPGKSHRPEIGVMEDVERMKKTQRNRMAAWFCNKPVIAQVHGFCFAAATDVVLCCDVIVAEENCRFAHPGMRALGGAPIGSFWPMLVGPLWAKRLLLTGDAITAKKAAEIGLITHAVPAKKLEECVEKIAKHMLAFPTTMLWTNKAWINRAFEIMGLAAIRLTTLDYNAIGHAAPECKEFHRIVAEQGLKAAMKLRDGAFDDYVSGPAIE